MNRKDRAIARQNAEKQKRIKISSIYKKRELIDSIDSNISYLLKKERKDPISEFIESDDYKSFVIRGFPEKYNAKKSPEYKEILKAVKEKAPRLFRCR